MMTKKAWDATTNNRDKIASDKPLLNVGTVQLWYGLWLSWSWPVQSCCVIPLRPLDFCCPCLMASQCAQSRWIILSSNTTQMTRTHENRLDQKNNIDIMAQTNNGQSHCRKSNVELFVIVFVWPKHDRNCMQHQKTAKCDEPCPCNYGSQHLSTLHTKNESFLGILINKPPCLPAGHFRVQARVQLAVERDLLKLFHIVPQVHPWWFVWFHRCSFHPS